MTFTSPRIVRCFSDLFAGAWAERRDELRAVSIGAVTSDELRRQGVRVVAEASRPEAEAMVRAVVRAVASRA